VARGGRDRLGPPARREPEPAKVQITHTSSWEGPIPPPATLEAFERIRPGAAEIIIAEFQAEAAHRRALETAQQAEITRDGSVGQGIALIFALGCFAVIAFAIAWGAYWVAGILGGTVIVGGITAILKSRADRPRG
jgi:uncharacterized membrane protein